MPTKCLKLLIFLIVVPTALSGQSDSARYLWNAGSFNPGDKFLRSDTADTLFMGNRQLFATDPLETTLVFPCFNLGAYEDSGGITIYPKNATVMWSFPRKYETQPDSYAYVTLGIAPDEFQISMEGNSPDNRDICFYTRRNINMVLKIPSDESVESNIRMIEAFNYNSSNAFNKFPFTVWCDRPGFGSGLTKFIDLNPSYANMGHLRDSVIVMNMRIDTLFGNYGYTGSGYAKFIRAQILDTTKFEIDVSGAYKIAGGSEIRPQAIVTDTVIMKNIAIEGSNCAGKIYVNEAAAFRAARFMPGITAEYSCLLTLAGDNDDFINLKSFCRTDSLIIRGSGGYAGFIEYLLYKKSTRPQYVEKPPRTEPVIPTGLEIRPIITNRSSGVRYAVPYTQYISLNLYDAVGRRVTAIVNNIVEPGIYSFELDFKGLSQGLYFLRLETGGIVSSEKVIFVR